MQFNPVQHCLSKFAQRCLLLWPHGNLFQLSAEPRYEFPARRRERPHAGLAAIVAMKSVKYGRLVRHRATETLAAQNATIERRKPATEPHRPVREVRKRKSPFGAALNFPRGEQQEPKHRIRHFLFGQNPLGDLAHEGEARAQGVVGLRLVKRLEQFALLNPDQVSRLLLDKPNLDVREKFERRTVPVLQLTRAARDATDAARCASKEAHQAICFAQRKGLQNDGFCFPGGHELSACRLWLAIRTTTTTTNAQTRTPIFITRTTSSQCSREAFCKTFADFFSIYGAIRRNRRNLVFC